jgi:hypothetical protein
MFPLDPGYGASQVCAATGESQKTAILKAGKIKVSPGKGRHGIRFKIVRRARFNFQAGVFVAEPRLFGPKKGENQPPEFD